jgi:hypothetical protein
MRSSCDAVSSRNPTKIETKIGTKIRTTKMETKIRARTGTTKMETKIRKTKMKPPSIALGPSPQ